MGALAAPLEHTPTQASALKIHVALDQNANRNPMEFLAILHVLSGTNPQQITPILTGLTHHAVNLHLHAADSPLHQLTRAALKLDLHAITPTEKNANSALQAFVSFLVNLISAHAGYVQPVFQMIIKRVFTMSTAKESLVSAMESVIFCALRTHPRCINVLVCTIQSNYPHAVRPPVEHEAFARACLRLAKEAMLTNTILVTIFERIAAIETLVPHEVFVDGSEKLCIEAERVEVVLLQLCEFFETQNCVEEAFNGYETFIIPIDSVRYVSYSMLFAASVATRKNENALYEIVERLWERFHDPSTPIRIRERFLEHAGAMVLRSKAYSSKQVVKWAFRVAEWLNGYIDASRGNEIMDVDVHGAFYTGTAVLLRVISRRCDAFGSGETLNNMRLYRILACRMNAMAMLPNWLVKQFVHTVRKTYGVDYREAALENEGVFGASTSLYGGRNQFIYRNVCGAMPLGAFRRKLDEWVLWD